jgi:hypothetical protein
MGRGWADVSEWAPIWWRTVGLAPLWIWVGTVALTCAAGRYLKAPSWTWAWTVVTFLAAARSRRLMAFAVVTAALLLLPHWRSRISIAPRWTGMRRGVLGGVLIAATAFAWTFIVPTLQCFPRAHGWNGPEPGAVAFFRSADVRGRLLVHFDFGEYAFYHLHDRLLVSIDNRRETVYSDAVVQGHLRFFAGQDPDYPARLGADAVWLPRSLDAVTSSLEQRGWFRRFEGPNTVVLLREPGPLVAGVATEHTPCFPNP